MDEPGDDVRAFLDDHPAGSAEESNDLARMRALAGQPDAWTRDGRLHFTGSAFVVHPPTRRVLLRWHARQAAWLQVGGAADPGETHPPAGAPPEAAGGTAPLHLPPRPRARLLPPRVAP